MRGESRARTPADAGVVWMATSYATKVHSLDGAMTDMTWRTACGLLIQDYRTEAWSRQNGSLIRWRLLNHDLLVPCRKCFR